MDGEQRSREDLLRQAQALGIEHPENMTRVELARAIAQLEGSTTPKASSSKASSWLEIARQLLAAVVEQGLNMPDAAALIRGETKLGEPPKPQPPLATVTLAKIYAAQGHVTRALTVLADVLKAEPDHRAALELQTQIKNKSSADAPRRRAASGGMAVAAAVSPMKLADESPAAPTVDEAASDQVESGQAPADQPEAAPVPAGSAHDALVLQLREGRASVVSWELAKETEAARAGGGGVEIEWMTFTPSWQGPIRQLIRVPITGAVGQIPVPKAAPPALTHAALCLRRGAQRVVLATLRK
jgi:hypothetical protein